MVDLSGSNTDELFFEDEDIVSSGKTTGAYPRMVKSDLFPEAPILNNPSAMEAYAPFLLDQESYLSEYAYPQLSDEELEKLYGTSDYRNERNLAIAKAGFALMQPTRGGQIGASISTAGQGLTNDLMAIQGAKRKEAKANAIGLINAKMQREAKQTLERKGVFDANRGLLLQVAGKEYDAQIAADKAMMAAYTDAMKSAQTKWADYQIKGVEPKRVQVRMKGPSGELEGNAFDAYVIQSINEEDGSLNPPQYYKPTNEVGPNGEAMYELIDNPEGIVEVKTTITGTPEDFRSKSGTFAGLQKYMQTYSQIFSDFYNQQYNGFFNEDKTLSDGRKIKAGEKFQSIQSSIKFTLNSEKYLADLKAGLVNQEDHEALVAADKSFDQLGAVGRGMMAAEINGGKNKYGVELFENEDERIAIFNKLGWFDTELPANEVRANSIIYAIARARKSSGRLNLDDIERAAKDLNIFGDSSVDVMTKIKELRRQLLEARADTLEQIKYTFPSYYEQMMDDGYAEYDSRRTDNLINQGAGSGSLEKGAGSNFTITLDGEVVVN